MLDNHNSKHPLLESILRELAIRDDKIARKQQHLLVQAAYLIATALALIVAFLAMLIILTPGLKNTFSDLKIPLPAIMEIFCSLGDLIQLGVEKFVPSLTRPFLEMQANFVTHDFSITVVAVILSVWMLLLSSLLVILLVYRIAGRTRYGTAFGDKILFKSLGLKKSFKKNLVRYLFRILGTLLNSGLTMSEALAICGKNIRDFHFAAAIDKLEQKALQKEPVMQPLLEFIGPDPIVSAMLETGEQNGTQGKIFMLIADHYDQEVDQSLHRLQFYEFIAAMTISVATLWLITAFYIPLIVLKQ